MMLLSCTAAVAADDDNQTKWMDEKYVSEGFNFNETTGGDHTNEISATQKTDVWLQVEASGQIDVTVPLVAVFKTNIDGNMGQEKKISKNYVITNNSTAPLAVTKVEIQDHKADVTVNGKTSNMTMVDTLNQKVYDQYKLTFFPEDHNTRTGSKGSIWTAAQNVGYAPTDPAYQTSRTFTKNGDLYTLDSGSTALDQKMGLWTIERKTYEGDKAVGKESYIQLGLETSPLSFVTELKDKDASAVENGIKLFTITYTVKIDDSYAVGEDIQGYEEGPVDGDFDYKYTGQEYTPKN